MSVASQSWYSTQPGSTWAPPATLLQVATSYAIVIEPQAFQSRYFWTWADPLLPRTLSFSPWMSKVGMGAQLLPNSDPATGATARKIPSRWQWNSVVNWAPDE